jgi:hypothetical protein
VVQVASGPSQSRAATSSVWYQSLMLMQRLFAIALPFALISCGSGTTGTGSSNGGASSSSGSIGAAPVGTLKCVDRSSGTPSCECAVASAKEGACSPQVLGGESHCCATVNAASTTQCNCERDATTNCCTHNGGCTCAVNNACNSPNSNPASCSAPSGGHCCKGERVCSCSSSACGDGEQEVAKCEPQPAVLKCLAPAVPVTSCQ